MLTFCSETSPSVVTQFDQQLISSKGTVGVQAAKPWEATTQSFHLSITLLRKETRGSQRPNSKRSKSDLSARFRSVILTVCTTADPGDLLGKNFKPLGEAKDAKFPFDRAAWWVRYWEGIESCNEKLLQSNPLLALHVVQDLTGAKTHYRRNVGEIDHIFPRSILREKGFDEAQINHFANFWILAKGKNQNKSARPPAQYFKDVPDEELDRALINRDMLDYKEFPKFIKARSQQMIDKVKNRLQFTDKDFRGLEDEE